MFENPVLNASFKNVKLLQRTEFIHKKIGQGLNHKNYLFVTFHELCDYRKFKENVDLHNVEILVVYNGKKKALNRSFTK